MDSGNHAMASRAYDRAIARATEAGEHALARYVIACKSEQSLMAGEISTALMCAREAQTVLGDARGTWRMTEAPLAWAADLEARALALTGQRQACEQRLEEAEALLTRSDESGREEEPAWIYHYVPVALAVHRGMCYTDLGLPEHAIPVLEREVERVPPERVRDRAYYLTYLAQAHVIAQDPDQAGLIGVESARWAVSTNSTRVLVRLRRLHADMDSRWDSPMVADLGELLATGPA